MPILRVNMYILSGTFKEILIKKKATGEFNVSVVMRCGTLWMFSPRY